MPRYALLLAYDGTDFAGWWRQAEGRTVAGCLDEALARLGEDDASPVGAARTDAGVHAQAQVAHCDCRRAWAPDDLRRALDGQLPDDLVCRSVVEVAADWHAVYASVGKTYTYHFHFDAVEDPFRRRWHWRPPSATDPVLLRAASELLVGSFDAGAFRRRGEYREDHAVVIDAVEWSGDGTTWCCGVRGDRFIYRLVRSLMGACCAVAGGAATMAELREALTGRRNAICQHQAPARGLHLSGVHYSRPLFGATGSQADSTPLPDRG